MKSPGTSMKGTLGAASKNLMCSSERTFRISRYSGVFRFGSFFGYCARVIEIVRRYVEVQLVVGRVVLVIVVRGQYVV